MNITDLSQLNEYLLQIIADCMNEVAQKVENLMKEHVETDVYSYDHSFYERTGQLRDSITYTDPVQNGNEIVSEIGNDTSQITSDPKHFIHGSKYWTPNNVSDMLPYLINEGHTGDFFGSAWENLARPFETNTYNELVSKDLIKEWMIQALKEHGLEVM
jgi:hypothetical protein